MDIKITSKEKQELFSRESIKFRITHEKQPTPSREDVKALLSKELKSEFVVIDNINSKFGLGISFGEARVYKDEKQMKELEPPHLLKRDSEPKQEAPEEKKEQPKEQEEEKKEDKAKEAPEEKEKKKEEPKQEKEEKKE